MQRRTEARQLPAHVEVKVFGEVHTISESGFLRSGQVHATGARGVEREAARVRCCQPKRAIWVFGMHG